MEKNSKGDSCLQKVLYFREQIVSQLATGNMGENSSKSQETEMVSAVDCSSGDTKWSKSSSDF